MRFSVCGDFLGFEGGKAAEAERQAKDFEQKSGDCYPAFQVAGITGWQSGQKTSG